MTWLPVERRGLAERDAVLGLRAEIDENVRDTLLLCWRIADPQLLDLCRLRLAQMTGARAELAGADDTLLAELAAWDSSAAFTERERAALGFAEQYLGFAEQYFLDHKLIGDDLREELARHLSRREIVNFVWALHMNDAYARLLSLLDIEPDPPGTPRRPERTPPAEPGRQWLGQPDADHWRSISRCSGILSSRRNTSRSLGPLSATRSSTRWQARQCAFATRAT